GKRSRSRITTGRPASARNVAAIDPAGPPPTTATSGARVTGIAAPFLCAVPGMSIRFPARAARRPVLHRGHAVAVEVDDEGVCVRSVAVGPGRRLQRRRAVGWRIADRQQHLIAAHPGKYVALLDQLDLPRSAV